MADLREGEGLRKLTEYLTQTRRQAEAAVDALNGEIAELQETNKRYLQLIDQLENEVRQRNYPPGSFAWTIDSQLL